MVIDMRPFETAADLRTKLRKKKGVNSNLFDSYMELMDVSSSRPLAGSRAKLVRWVGY